MGFHAHHAIVLTSNGGDLDGIKAAHTLALEIFGEGQVSPLTKPTTNAFRSFFVSPDGSKEGWNESRTGDQHREHFIKALRRFPKRDLFLSWVEVYWDESGSAKVLRRRT